MPKATVTLNTQLNGVEIRFDAKPGADVLERLKNARWRWSRNNGCWYKSDTVEAREFANKIAGCEAVPTSEPSDEAWIADFTDVDGRLGA